jgi:hypothetical protein
MFFLLRTAFWMSVVLVLLPSGESKTQAGAERTGAADALTFASATVSDMSRFCERRPEACVAGANAAMTFGQRTIAGARMVYEFLNDRLGPTETGSLPRAGDKPDDRIADRPAEVGGKPSQHTLRASDLSVPWRLPPPRPPAAHKDPV